MPGAGGCSAAAAASTSAAAAARHPPLLQARLRPELAIIAEVGDSWFNSQKLRLPDGCGWVAPGTQPACGWPGGCAGQLACWLGGWRRAAGPVLAWWVPPAAGHLPLSSPRPPRPTPACLPACLPTCLCSYELQLRYGSIGWSVGATLGYALGAAGSKRVLALIGDGSFQQTAQVNRLKRAAEADPRAAGQGAPCTPCLRAKLQPLAAAPAR